MYKRRKVSVDLVESLKIPTMLVGLTKDLAKTQRDFNNNKSEEISEDFKPKNDVLNIKENIMKYNKENDEEKKEEKCNKINIKNIHDDSDYEESKKMFDSHDNTPKSVKREKLIKNSKDRKSVV